MADRFRIAFLEAFDNHQVVIVVGDTDSGKTTEVPQWCLQEIRHPGPSSGGSQRVQGLKVVCTQPKRAAAVSAATRVAREQGVTLGQEVGFAIRFESRFEPATPLKYVTDGTLLREARADPLLSTYGCIVLDEVQERTAATDILLCLVRQALSKRTDIKLVVMMTTLDAGQFQRYFDGAPIVHMSVRPGCAPALDEILLGPRKSVPEILRSDLMTVVLELKRFGVDDLASFGLMDPPKTEDLNRAEEALKCLGALDDAGTLTKIGETMAGFPLHPQMARALVASCEFNCSDEIRTLISMLSSPGHIHIGHMTAEEDVKADQDPILAEGDHFAMLAAYRAFGRSLECPEYDEDPIHVLSLKRARQIDSHLATIMDLLNLERNSTEASADSYSLNIRKALVVGFFMQVAYRGEDGEYRTVRDNNVVKLHPATCLKSEPDWVVYSEYVGAPENCIRTVTAIEPESLLDFAPRFYTGSRLLHSDVKSRLQAIAGKRKASRDCRH